MPKRKCESKEEKWRRKVKKYEEKLNQRRRRRIVYSDDEDVNDQDHLENECDPYIVESEPQECLIEGNNAILSDEMRPEPSNELTESAPLEECSVQDNFDPQLLQALGDSDTELTEYGDEIQSDLATRFQRILLSGLKSECKLEIIKKYSYPKNIPLAKTPILNPEIRAMLAETCKLRDKRLFAKQEQLGKALSALGYAMTGLLKKSPDIPEIIRTLNDLGQLLADSHYAESDTRRSVIIPLIDKTLSESFKYRKRDSYLFGDNLGELVKNSRGIKKTSQLIQGRISSSVHLNGRGSSTRARYQNHRAGQMYTSRIGGPTKPMMTSYAHPAYPSRTRAPPPPAPPAPARRPGPPARRQTAARAPRTHR